MKAKTALRHLILLIGTVCLFGDSVIAGDLLPSQLRRRLQRVFGYGGPGFVCMDKPFKYYFNRDINWQASRSWKTMGVLDPAVPDKMAGNAGA